MNFKFFGSVALWAAVTGMVFAGSKDMKEIEANTAPIPSEAGWYAGLFGGADFDQDYFGKSERTDLAGIPGNTQSSIIRNAIGGGGGMKFGYNFNVQDCVGLKLQPAIEAEAFYMDPRIWTGSDFNYTPPGLINAAAAADPAFSARVSGDLRTAAFFVNGILRVKTDSIFTPYFGAGIGVEYLRLENVNISVSANGVPISSAVGGHDDDFCFGMQGLAGCDVRLASHWSLFTEYKYIVAVDPSFTFNNYDGAGSSYSLKSDFLGQDIITAGVKYNF